VVNFLNWLGNLKEIMLMISSAVVFAVLLVVYKYDGHVDSRADSGARRHAGSGFPVTAGIGDAGRRGSNDLF
jgi:hypothetical protein